jgi:glycine/D-amino acid oxidase-like deaminating enzyme
MAKTQVDYLIAGQGLAGSLLAWRLLQRQQRVLVVDEQHRQSASMVAAGLVTPITGMRLVKTAHIETLLPHALQDYRQLGSGLRQRFYHPRPMLRLFAKAQEAERWRSRCSMSEYRPWLRQALAPGQWQHFLENPLGGFFLAHAGYLDIPRLLHQLKRHLIENNAYRSGRICPDECRIEHDKARWQDVSARVLIFCEGHQARFNPWFRWLPFRVAKGEIITLNYAGRHPGYIVNRGRWLLPTQQGQFRFGANYEHAPRDIAPSDSERDKLLAALPSLTPRAKAFQLVQHEAGIRPASADTQPFIGRHPRHPSLAIFNGFGSKGSLSIPYCASRFADHLLQEAPLPVWADIARYHAQSPAAG